MAEVEVEVEVEEIRQDRIVDKMVEVGDDMNQRLDIDKYHLYKEETDDDEEEADDDVVVVVVVVVVALASNYYYGCKTDVEYVEEGKYRNYVYDLADNGCGDRAVSLQQYWQKLIH